MGKIFIGYDARGKKMFLAPEDRETHMHIIGSTGTGKSKLMEWMIRDDIKKGHGLCLIDPHGSLYKDVVKWCAYHDIRDREIILINPSGGDHVIGFNPFIRSADDISVQVDYMITATIRAWDMEGTDETPTLERWLRCIYQTLIEKSVSLLASEFLIDRYESTVREYLTSGISNRLIASEWRRVDTTRQRQFDEEIISTKNRLMRFLCSNQVCRFMGLSGFNIDLRAAMDEGKVILVNLAESDQLSHYNARLFGALLINEFCRQAKRRRKDKYDDKLKPFYLYIDEFQNFMGLDIASGLDQLRKFGLHFILAHQRLGQVGGRETDIIDAILHNTKIRAVFGGLRREDAILMVEEMFVNQLDLKQVKKAIYQTKFWPKYSRDKIYTRMESHSSGTSMMRGATIGTASHNAPPAEGWFDSIMETIEGPKVLSVTESTIDSTSEGSFESDSWSEGEADIPIFIPVPFKELSSMEYWSLEEVKWQMSDALKGQFSRHCFIQVPGERTQPMLVPFVRDYYVDQEDVVSYEQCLYEQSKALPTSEVDRLIAEERKMLERRALELTSIGEAAELTPQRMRHREDNQANRKELVKP